MHAKPKLFNPTLCFHAALRAIGNGQFCVELRPDQAHRLGHGKKIPMIGFVEGLGFWGNIIPRRGGGYRLYIPTFIVEIFHRKSVGDLVELKMRAPEPHEPGGSKYQPYFLPGGKVRPVADQSIDDDSVASTGCAALRNTVH